MKEETGQFDLINTTKGKLPSLPFVQMKEAVLGKEYSLSVAIISEKKMHELNLAHRGKDKATDILSFPLEKTEGEIFINLEHTKIKAKEFDRTFENYLAFLFIHGLVHLKGFDHGSRMENEEAKYRAQFGI